MYTGRVVNFRGTFGFLEYDSAAQDPTAASSSSSAAPAEPKAAEAAHAAAAAGGCSSANGPSKAAAAAAEPAAEKPSGNGAAPEAGGGGAAASAEAAGEKPAGGGSRALPRLFFSANDIEGNAALKAGDEVRFSIASKPSRQADSAGAGSGSEREKGGPSSASKDVVARRVLRTKACNILVSSQR
jgi:hypothetical protein